MAVRRVITDRMRLLYFQDHTASLSAHVTAIAVTSSDDAFAYRL